jgi:type II secretory pathway predicted ATPase ExeA
MLEKHFALKLTPFTREIDVDRKMSLPFLDSQLDALEETVKRRMSASLISPPGTGKSFILRQLAAKLPQARYKTTYFKLNRLSGRDLCREIAQAVGARSVGSYPGLVRAVQDRFEQASSTDGIRPVLIFDDAHALKPEGFELLKILTNFEMDSRLVLSIVLAGHPSLKQKLHRDEFEDIRQRIAYCGELRLLSRDETHAYVSHRMTIAGASILPFDTDSIEGIFEMSRGNLRAIDSLALHSLKKAAGAQHKTVGLHHVHQARAEIWI